MDDMNFEAQSQSFLAWFKSLPGSTFNDDLLLADLRIRNAGRGIGEFLPICLSMVTTPTNTPPSRKGQHPCKHPTLHHPPPGCHKHLNLQSVGETTPPL